MDTYPMPHYEYANFTFTFTLVVVYHGSILSKAFFSQGGIDYLSVVYLGGSTPRQPERQG